MELNVVDIVSECFNVSKDFVHTKSRRRNIVDARKALCSVLYMEYKFSHRDIAEFMKYADHSTPQHHVAHSDILCKVDEEYNKKYTNVIKKVYSNI